MGRTVIVGDVHGCSVELEALLAAVGFTDKDRLVLAGDLVARGPDSLGVLDIARRTAAVVVRGNHEQKLLLWRAHKRGHARGVGRRPEPLSRTHASVARELRKVDWLLLERAPCVVDLPDHGVRVIHAGLDPRVAFDEQETETLLHIRSVPVDGAPVPWGALYTGPPHVVFGHNAMREPQLHPWATGLDTSCVYGGRLSAIVLAAGEKMPRGGAVRDRIVSVPALRAYVAKKGFAEGDGDDGGARRKAVARVA